MIQSVLKSPLAIKRFKRFKEIKRAYISLWVLVIIYFLSLFSELICNSSPLYVRFEGKSYFPVFKFYSQDTFKGNKKNTRPNYHRLNISPEFKNNPHNFMIFPPFSFGPYKSIPPESIEIPDQVTLQFIPTPRVGSINIKSDYSITRSSSFGFFLKKDALEVRGLLLTSFFQIPESIKEAVAHRFANKKASYFSANSKPFDGKEVLISLSSFKPRNRPPKTVRLTFREIDSTDSKDAINNQKVFKFTFNKQLNRIGNTDKWKTNDLFNGLSQAKKDRLLAFVKKRFVGPVDGISLNINEKTYNITFDKKDVRFPFHPIKGHIMGIDSSGRDVLARILYGLRTSMTFGLLLVFFSMIIGITAGAVQGYYGGLFDIASQRFIEIWSALPFLYIMILLGSIYGRTFSLLLFCYGLFNWIGISYYMRAEFFRLRKQPFVEAAKCMGLSSFKIIVKHILPNSLVPVITFFPFSLVGAIGALAALDYLGFGLPPPTPSWGDLLFQAQQYRWAWWLILYPSLALFIVMLLGVFIGEGIRQAHDPKRYARLE